MNVDIQSFPLNSMDLNSQILLHNSLDVNIVPISENSMDVDNWASQSKRLTRAERIQQRRVQESNEAKMQRLQRDAAKHRSRRLQQSAKENQKQREKDASRKRQRREEENDVERRKLQAKDASHQRQRRQQSSSLYAALLENAFPSESYIGKMDSVCRHYGALHFENECASGRKEEFKQCCHYGSVQLPELLTYPDEMKDLLQGTDVEGKNFRENIRSYNNALAFASIGALIDLPRGFGSHCFRIHGKIYH